MPDQIIPADQARRARQWARDTLDDVENGANVSAYARDAARTLMAMMPRPTLADMTTEERDECRWMQADVKDRGGRYVIANPDDEEGDAGLVSADGEIEWMFPERVTPRPDLPRMEWPGDQKPAPAPALPHGWRLADHRDHGRVIVTTPESDSGGKVAFVHQNDFWDRKYSGDWCKPDELTYIDTEPEDDQ